MPDLAAVAFDFGGPVLRTPFEMIPAFERDHGLSAGTYAWFGPFDPDADSLWRQMQAGQLTERDYWLRRAEEVAELTGGSAQADLFGAFFSASQAEMVRPEAEQFAHEVRSLGLQTAVLTNDLAHFHTQEWIAGIDFLSGIDVMVDGSLTGALKPSPRAYEILIERLSVAPERVLFIDDQPANIEGAQRAGLATCWFDVRDPVGSYARARVALGGPGAG